MPRTPSERFILKLSVPAGQLDGEIANVDTGDNAAG